MEAKKPQNLQSLSWRPRRPVVRLIQSIHYQNFTGKETKTWKACCCCSVAKSCSTLCDPWTEACQASLSITNSRNLLRLMSIKLVMPIQPFYPLSSTSLPGFISFRTDRFDLLAVQGTLKSLFQNQFKSISSSVLRLLHGPTLTSIHDYWINHSFDYTNFCWQSDVSAF